MKQPKPWPPKVDPFPRDVTWVGTPGGWEKFNVERGQVCLRFRNHGKDDKVYSTISIPDAIVKRNKKLAATAERIALDARLSNGNLTVTEMVEAMLNAGLGPDHAPGTPDRYEATARIIARQPLGQMRASDVEVHHIDQMLESLTPVPYGYSQIKALRTLLRQAFKYGQRHKFCDNDPAALSVIPGKTPPPKKTKWLNENEYLPMLDYLTEHRAESSAYVALLIILLMGLRPAEVLALKWEQVDLKGTMTITVDHQMQRSNQGRTRTRVPVLKTELSYRTIAIPPELAPILHELWLSRPWDLLFINHRGNPTGFDILRWHIDKACADLGFGHYTPHHLRHTCATFLLSHGVLPADVAHQMGHTIDVLLSTYAHHFHTVADSRENVTRGLTELRAKRLADAG